jgi:hypothetical protein
MKNWLARYLGSWLFALTCACSLNCSKQLPLAKLPAGSDPGGYSAQERRYALALDVTCLNTERGFYTVRGTGVMVASRYALTAGHVVECGGGTAWEIKATDYRGRSVSMTVEKGPKKTDPDDVDAALLVVTGTTDPFVEWARAGAMPSKPTHGGSVQYACAANAVPFRTWKCGPIWGVGVVEGTSSVDGEFVVEMVGDFGNSGSGVFDEQGKLIGLIVRLVPCSNGQFCSLVIEGVDGFRGWIAGLASMDWFDPQQNTWHL